jgi:Protein of unknown function (DUF3054)
VRVWLASVADGAAVLLFAGVGRLSHAEGVTPLGVLEVAWPFLAGGAVGTLAGRTWRRPAALVSGAYVWAGTLVGGMLLRALSGGGVQVSFVIVAAVVLAFLMLGWRLVARTRLASVRRSSIGGAPR